MTIRELITRLADYPPDAEIHLIGLEDPWLADRRETVAMMADKKDALDGEGTLEYAQRWCDEYGGNMLYIDAEATDDNAYRRGALEQLFDEVSTGITEDDIPHGQTREASGLHIPTDAEVAQWEASGGTPTDIEIEVRVALETHFGLFLEEATTFVTVALLEDWPDPDGIRERASEHYWARLNDELENTGADISCDVREYDEAWDVFIDLVFERANKAARAVRGYTEK